MNAELHGAGSRSAATTAVRVQAVVVHHRGAEMLAECLATMLAADEVELDVVLLANACQEPLPQLASAEPRLHVLASASSLGFAAANNLAVTWARERLGTPDYYYFVNNDLRHRPGALAALMACARAHPEAGVIGPQIRIWGAGDHLNSLGINLTVDGWAWDEGIGRPVAAHPVPSAARSVAAVTGSALLIAAPLFARLGGWCELYDYYFEDVDLCLRAWESGSEVMVEPAAIVEHRISATMTIAAEQKFFYFWRNRLLLAWRHWPLGEALGVLRLARREIADFGPTASALQRRALRGALHKLPAALRLRLGARGARRPWRRFLRAADARPHITLPAAAELGSTLASTTVPPLADEPAPTETPSASPAPEEVPVAPMPLAGVDCPGATNTEPWAPPVATWRRAQAAGIPAAGARPRVLVLGWGPLPFEPARMNYAPGARSWQFAQALAGAGCAVVLACARIPGAADGAPDAVTEQERDGVLIYTLDREPFATGRALLDLALAFAPDVLVGAAAVPSRRALEVAAEADGLPVWVDVFGDLMAEGQARAARLGDDAALGAYQELLLALAEGGSAFSAVGERQRWALLGQLLLAGRATASELGEELVHAVPISLPSPHDAEQVVMPVDTPPASVFVVIWSGGFNTWCDVETLVAALEMVMAELPELLFVATGGPIVGHDELTYEHLRQLVAGTREPARYRLLAALPAAEARGWRARADLAVVTERPSAERWLGSSHRVMEWLATATPFVCADLSDLGRWVAARGAGLCYAAGDAGSLAERLRWAHAHRDELPAMASAAREHAATEWSLARTTEPLVRWVAARAARDPRRDERVAGPISLAQQRRTVLAQAAALAAAEVAHARRLAELAAEIGALGSAVAGLQGTLAAKELEAARLADQVAASGRQAVELAHLLAAEQQAVVRLGHELGTIHHSRMWRVWMGSIALRRMLTAPFRWLVGRAG